MVLQHLVSHQNAQKKKNTFIFFDLLISLASMLCHMLAQSSPGPRIMKFKRQKSYFNGALSCVLSIHLLTWKHAGRGCMEWKFPPNDSLQCVSS